MKTIVVFIDYTSRSEHAVKYAVHLAKKIKANIFVADVIKKNKKPTIALSNGALDSVSGFSDPDDNFRLLNFCRALENELAENTLPGKFSPSVSCCQQEMPLHKVVDFFEEHKDIAFILLGTNLYYGAASIMLGDTCGNILALSNSPVILVPEDAPVRYAEKYVYLADINTNNVLPLAELAKLAEYSAASIMLVSINAGRPMDADQEKALKLIMKDDISQVDYGRIYYRYLPNNVLKSDTEWLMQDNNFEMLAITYDAQGVINPLLQFGFEDKIIGNVNVPLLIYPTKLG